MGGFCLYGRGGASIGGVKGSGSVGFFEFRVVLMQIV